MNPAVAGSHEISEIGIERRRKLHLSPQQHPFEGMSAAYIGAKIPSVMLS
jgi:hypothetical protein